MAEMVRMWKSKDGSLFDSEMKADLHDESYQIEQDLIEIFNNNGTSAFYDLLKNSLVAYVQRKMAERDHWHTVTNNDD